MQGTPAPGDDADSTLESQELIRRAKLWPDLKKASKAKALQKVKDRERHAEKLKKELKADYERLLDLAAAEEEERDSQLGRVLCSDIVQEEQQIKELKQQLKDKERRNMDRSHQFRELRARMKQDAMAKKERPDLDVPYQQRVREVEEDLARYKADCDAAHKEEIVEIGEYVLHDRGDMSDLMSHVEPFPESGAELADADGHNTPQPRLSAGHDGTACPSHTGEAAAPRDTPDVPASAAEKRNRSGTPTDAENGLDQDHVRGGPRKRARRDSAIIPTIDYNDVYQDGNPETMYEIVYYPKSNPKNPKTQPLIEPGWFIVRCLEHPLHGGSNRTDPLASAGKHINGIKHNYLPKDHNTVIKTLGFRVLNCDAAKAEKNNAMLPPRTRNPQLRADNTRYPKNFNVPQPEVGKPYTIRDEGRAWVVMMLPLGGYFADFGVQGHFDDALRADTPRCFKRGQDGELLFVNGTLEWADGYQDGQPRVSERKYPVMFFNKPPAWLKWVRARELKPYDLEDPEIHRKSGSRRAKTHYELLQARKQEVWLYINGQVDDQPRGSAHGTCAIGDATELGATVPRPVEQEPPTNAPTPHIEDEDDDLQAVRWDSGESSDDESSGSDWGNTDEGRTVSVTTHWPLVRDVAQHPDTSQVASQINNQESTGPTTSAAAGFNVPSGRAPSALIPSASEPTCNQVEADDQHLWSLSPSPTNDQMSPHQMHEQPYGGLDGLTAPPMRDATLRELQEKLNLAPIVDPRPAMSPRRQLSAWAQPTGSNTSSRPPAGAAQMMRQWGQLAPEADMSATGMTPPPVTAIAEQTRQTFRFSVSGDDLGRFTPEVMEVMGP